MRVSCCDVIRVKQRSDADRRSPEGERQSPSEDEADEKLSSAEIHNAEDYKEIFQPKNAICRWRQISSTPGQAGHRPVPHKSQTSHRPALYQFHTSMPISTCISTRISTNISMHISTSLVPCISHMFTCNYTHIFTRISTRKYSCIFTCT